MAFRSFFVKYSMFIIVFVLANAVVWFGWTRVITDPNRQAGDLLRVGYIHGFVSARENVMDLPRRHLELDDFKGQKIDVITVGDSFSMGGGGGRNNYYQDYIASIQGLTVLNIHPRGEHGQIMMVRALLRQGCFDTLKPRYVLLETVGRYAALRFTNYAGNNNSDIPQKLKEICSHKTNKVLNPAYDKTKQIKPTKTCPENNRIPLSKNDLNFINNGNIKFILNNIQYTFMAMPFGSKVMIESLNTRLFSGNKGNKIILYKEDIDAAKSMNQATVNRINDELNDLSMQLSQKDIKLIFMPAVDKYDLYEPYIQNRKYPENIFFDLLRKKKHDYTFIDTKQILSRALSEGKLDIFYQDDTHWTWRASEEIFNQIKLKRRANAIK